MKRSLSEPTLSSTTTMLHQLEKPFGSAPNLRIDLSVCANIPGEQPRRRVKVPNRDGERAGLVQVDYKPIAVPTNSSLEASKDPQAKCARTGNAENNKHDIADEITNIFSVCKLK